MGPVEPKSCNQRRSKKCRLYPLGHPADSLRITENLIAFTDKISNVEKCNNLCQLSIIFF